MMYNFFCCPSDSSIQRLPIHIGFLFFTDQKIFVHHGGFANVFVVSGNPRHFARGLYSNSLLTLFILSFSGISRCLLV